MENQNKAQGVAAAEIYRDEVLIGLLPDLKAIDDEDLVAIGVDVKSVTATVLGSLTEIRKLSTEIAKAEPKWNAAALDKLERAAYALNLANAQYWAAGQPANDLLAMVDEGVKLRERLLSDAKTLAGRGLIDKSRIAHVQLGVGYKILSGDLLIIATVLRDSWPNIQGKCATEEAEFERAAQLGQEIIAVVGKHEKPISGATYASDIRARAFTLVVKLYDDLRRVITFLRWKGDEAERIAPSLYANRGGRRRSDVPEVQPPAPPVTPSTAGNSSSANGVAAIASTPNGNAVDEDSPFMNRE